MFCAGLCLNLHRRLFPFCTTCGCRCAAEGRNSTHAGFTHFFCAFVFSDCRLSVTLLRPLPAIASRLGRVVWCSSCRAETDSKADISKKKEQKKHPRIKEYELDALSALAGCLVQVSHDTNKRCSCSCSSTDGRHTPAASKANTRQLQSLTDH